MLRPIGAVSGAGWALRAVGGVPSGQGVELYEVLIDRVGQEEWLRFRFLAPQIGKEGNGLAFEEASGDFDYLCMAVALPYMRDFDLEADVIAITLQDRPFEFGVAVPDATQFIETFTVENGRCVPEGLW